MRLDVKNTNKANRHGSRRRGQKEGREEKKGKSGGTTGGTYCQVGPGGVARVAPLSDSTHKRRWAKKLAVSIK